MLHTLETRGLLHTLCRGLSRGSEMTKSSNASENRLGCPSQQAPACYIRLVTGYGEVTNHWFWRTPKYNQIYIYIYAYMYMWGRKPACLFFFDKPSEGQLCFSQAFDRKQPGRFRCVPGGFHTAYSGYAMPKAPCSCMVNVHGA